MMIDAADLFEIGKYIDSPLKKKFFPNKGDIGAKALGSRSEINAGEVTARKKAKALEETSCVWLQIHRWIHSYRHPPTVGLTFPT